ncbi:MAG: AgmX/PglI C-terminal domain-containing protein [Myxococcaceae bacterium]|nr:AgmX/PglI C-terminal domain-containing protein [Myxococcaceae bacterium]
MRYFQEAGAFGWLVALVGVMALAESVIALALSLGKPKLHVFTVAAAVSTLLVLVLGGVGTLLGQQQVERALAVVNPRDAEVILYVGYAEAKHCAVLGLAFAAIPFALVAAAAFLRPAPAADSSLQQGPLLTEAAPQPLRTVVLGALGLGVLVAAALTLLVLKPLPGKPMHEAGAADPVDAAAPAPAPTDEPSALAEVQHDEPAAAGGAPVPEVPAPVAEEDGVDREAIGKYARVHAKQIRACYEKQLAKAPTLAGKVTVHFVIGTSGHAQDVTIAEDTTGSEPLTSCIRGMVATWTLPVRPKEPVDITYPFVFAAAK